jgi:DNA modification methylase
MDAVAPSPTDDIWSGREPSIERKREAKKVAWGNGARPSTTSHRVFLGDARKIPTKPAEDVHLVVTSPPYFNVVEYSASNDKAQLGHYDDYDTFLDDLDKVWSRCFRRLVPGGRMCIVVGDVCIARRKQGRHHVIPLHADIAVRCRKIGFDYLTPILWAKIANTRTEVGGSARFLGKPYEPNGIIKNDVEYILMLRKPGNYRKPTAVQRALSILEPEEHDRGYRGVWTDIRGQNRADGHPAPYPIDLAERLIRLFSFVGDTVLDPFWGSGTTSIAAARAARSSIGYEIERTYLDIGKRRASRDKTEIAADYSFEYAGG